MVRVDFLCHRLVSNGFARWLWLLFSVCGGKWLDGDRAISLGICSGICLVLQIDLVHM